MLSHLEDVITGLRFIGDLKKIDAASLQLAIRRLYSVSVPIELASALVHIIDRSGKGYITSADLATCKIHRDHLGDVEKDVSWLVLAQKYIDCVKNGDG